MYEIHSKNYISQLRMLTQNLRFLDCDNYNSRKHIENLYKMGYHYDGTYNSKPTYRKDNEYLFTYRPGKNKRTGKHMLYEVDVYVYRYLLWMYNKFWWEREKNY